MQIVLFSSSLEMTEEFQKRETIENLISVDELDSLNKTIKELKTFILIVDYDSVAQEFNKLISSNTLPTHAIVLERVPEIITGKMLISKRIKAYGNTRMLNIHFKQMIDAVSNSKVWTYPQLTIALANMLKKPTISQEAKELIENRLSQKESEVVYLVLEGLTNDAIANQLEITTRTVKAHVSAIFQKLHVNDRIALVLLLR